MKKILIASVLICGCDTTQLKVGEHVPIHETQKALILRKYETDHGRLHVDMKNLEMGDIDSYELPWTRKRLKVYANLITGKIERVHIGDGEVDAIVTDSTDPVVTIAAE